jgi:hypothetical protein
LMTLQEVRSASGVFATVVATILVIGGLACPFWMAISHCDAHGSLEDCQAADQCSLGACVADSPRLASHIAATRITAGPSDAAVLAARWSFRFDSERWTASDEHPIPATTIFLRTHSLLI